MAPSKPVTWLATNEKYAILGLDCEASLTEAVMELHGGFLAFTRETFQLPKHWRDWLGEIRSEEIEEFGLYLVAKQSSQSPTILDGENKELRTRLGRLYAGLQLDRRLHLTRAPFLASGGWNTHEGVDVREYSPLNTTGAGIVNDLTPVSPQSLTNAAAIASRLAAINSDRTTSHWRLMRCLNIFQDACRSNDVLDRIHQFTRCVEGLIAAKQGETKRLFKSRTELFVGPRHHSLMGEVYDLRSDVEHLHENRHLETYDRVRRIRLGELEAIAEWIARSCLRRIILEPSLTPHFGSEHALHDFWAFDPAAQRALWGPPIDPTQPLKGFDFDHVSDAELGAY